MSELSGTCEWNLSEKWRNAKGDDHVYGYETECGRRHTWWPDTLPSYCPSCGKKVKMGETMQQIGQVIESTVKRGVYGDTEPQDADSREKLEADVRKHYAYSTTTLMYPPSANKTTDMLRALPVDTVIGWLDRQAAITERENLASRLDSYELATMIDATIKERNELEAKLAETSELLSQAHLDWLNDVGEYEEIIDKLKADLNTAVCDNNSLRYELTCLAERDIDDTPKYCPNCGTKVMSE